MYGCTSLQTRTSSDSFNSKFSVCGLCSWLIWKPPVLLPFPSLPIKVLSNREIVFLERSRRPCRHPRYGRCRLHTSALPTYWYARGCLNRIKAGDERASRVLTTNREIVFLERSRRPSRHRRYSRRHLRTSALPAGTPGAVSTGSKPETRGHLVCSPCPILAPAAEEKSQ
jgi:hypothetical protein